MSDYKKLFAYFLAATNEAGELWVNHYLRTYMFTGDLEKFSSLVGEDARSKDLETRQCALAVEKILKDYALPS